MSVKADRRSAMRVLLLMAAVTYAGLPWEAIAGFPLDPVTSYLSELGAEDQRLGLVFRGLDLITGVLVVAAVVIGLHTSARSPLIRMAGFALCGFAILTIVDALNPMACATSSSAACARADAANALGISHQLHTVSSASATAAVLVSALLFGIALRRTDALPARVRRIPGGIVAGLVGITLVAGAWALVSTSGGQLLAGGGIAQRVQVLLVSGYLVVFALLSHRLAPRGGGGAA